MSDALADIETLALRCRTERAREYIGEAIQCYRAGAYRSTIVNTWIAVVFDLIDKVRELSLVGDAAALEINTRYESYIAQIESGNDQGIRSALEFESTIISTCKERLQFFTHQQLRDLERLREDRHQCAHPSFQKPGEPYRPTAEHARLHLRSAVEHVLSQPPVQGRSAIAEVVSVVASEYFPKDRTQAITVLRSGALANATDVLVRGVVDALVFGFDDPASALYRKTQVGSALSALLEIIRGQAEQRLAQQLSKLVRDIDDPGLPSLAVLVVSIPDALMLLDQPARIRLAEFVRTGPETEVVRALGGLARHPEITPLASARVLSFDVDRLAEAITVFGVSDLAKERALVLLSEAGNWNRVNDIFLRVVMPLFESFTRDDVERIIRMPTETRADLPGAVGYSTFIDQVRQTDLIPEADLNALLRANRARLLVPDEQGE